jgi:signal transduction histidine kinase
MAGKREVEEVLRTINREALLLLDCKLSAFFLYSKEEDLLHLNSLQDRDGPRSFSESLSPSDSILGTCLKGHRQVQTEDLLRTEEHHFVNLIREEELHSMLVTPVLYEDDSIGVLSLYVDRPHRFNDDEKLIARALADLGAIAVQNARLYGRVFDSEESLRKSERLTTLGTLAAEIAHEIRNPLMVIRLLFDSLDLDQGDDDYKNKDLSVIREKLDHLEQIAGRILDFGKSREAFRKDFALQEIIEDAALLVRLKLEQSQVNLHIKDFKENLLVYVDKGQIQQALLNLMLNALVAMPNGGQLTLEAGRSADGKAQILVSDTGSGIPNELQGQIFDSFLTGTTDGTGLGLSISKRILRAHDGDLELLESGENGTIFRIILPLVIS